jgi:acyl carrier protein
MKESELDSDSTFEKYGVDSLAALAVTQRFERDLGSRLPATLLFEYPTVAALTAYALEHHRESLAQRFSTGEEPQQQPTPATRAPAPKPSGDMHRSSGPEGGSVSHRDGGATALAPTAMSLHDARKGSSAVAAEDEGIAVVGIAGRYPMADTVDELWENLKDGRNCVTEIPRTRWDAQAHYSADAAGN